MCWRKRTSAEVSRSRSARVWPISGARSSGRRYTSPRTGVRASRRPSYPEEALREVLVNALYHRGYDEGSPHTTLVRITSDRIDIRSTPGPVAGVGRDALVREATPKLVPPRNPRVGELFKEIGLAEKRLTGLDKVYKAMERNGSPAPGVLLRRGAHVLPGHSPCPRLAERGRGDSRGRRTEGRRPTGGGVGEARDRMARPSRFARSRRGVRATVRGAGRPRPRRARGWNQPASGHRHRASRRRRAVARGADRGRTAGASATLPGGTIFKALRARGGRGCDRRETPQGRGLGRPTLQTPPDP